MRKNLIFVQAKELRRREEQNPRLHHPEVGQRRSEEGQQRFERTEDQRSSLRLEPVTSFPSATAERSSLRSVRNGIKVIIIAKIFFFFHELSTARPMKTSADRDTIIYTI